VLDAVCYPNGHLIQYSYRRKHVHPVLREDPTALVGREAVIIFVDSDGKGQVTYFPLRRAKIHAATFEEGQLSPPALKERIKLYLQLDDYVRYDDYEGERQWHERVQQFDAIREIVSAKPKYFVIGGEDVFQASPHSSPSAWEDLVTVMSKSKDFPDAVFLRLGHIKGYRASRFRSDSDQEVSRRYEADRLVYLLRPGDIYRLDLSVYESPSASPGDGANLEIKASAKDSLDVDQPHQSFVSGLAEKSALIACKRSIESIITTITVRAERAGISGKLVNAPSPTLFVRIGVDWWIVPLFVVVVFVGGFAISIDTGLAKELWVLGWPFTTRFLTKLIGAPVTTTFLTRLIGAAMLAGAAFLGFRKLPSGQR
jgi:hypothetical protein